MPSLASADWLQARPTQVVLGCLAAEGFTARVVGGAVRNALLGRPVADIDIATNATPDQVLAAAAGCGLKTIATGLAHGTVTVLVEGRPFEVTTLRLDVETDGRRATVAFTDDWAADALRRDLTLNALYCDAAGHLFDPIGGLDDVLARRVRFIGDARMRIREDYLRILRFFRFTAQYSEAAPDAEGLVAALAERDGLKRLSAERVRAELLRLLAAPRAVAVIGSMADHGLLTAVLPVAPRLDGFGRLVANETALGLSADPALRLASLTVAVAEDAPRLARYLRLSAQEREVLELAGLPSMNAIVHDEHAQRAELYQAGSAEFRRRVLLAWAGCGADPNDAGWRRLFELPARWDVPPLPFAGRDLMLRGMPPGPRIGEVLSAFEAWWIAHDFPDDRAELERMIDHLVAVV